MKIRRQITFLRDAKGQPVGCIAYSVRSDKTKIQYQVSVLNPVDRFERPLARQIALGRLIEKPITFVNNNSKAGNLQILSYLMRQIADNMDLPSRARKAANLWLKKNG